MLWFHLYLSALVRKAELTAHPELWFCPFIFCEPPNCRHCCWQQRLDSHVLGPIAPNEDKGLNRDMLVILDQFIHDPVAQT